MMKDLNNNSLGSVVSSLDMRDKTFIYLLALLCATAQKNYFHDVGVRRPSVDIVLSERDKWIDTKFW